MAKTIADLNAKVDELQAALDKEQDQVNVRNDAQNTTITELKAEIETLKAQIAAGGTVTEEDLQALSDKLDTITADVSGTVPDEPANP